MSEVEKYNQEYSAKDAMTDELDGRKKKKKKKLPFAKRLQNMVFDEVSLVGRPANELATVVLHKSGDSEFAGVEEVDTISLNNQVEIEEGEIRMSENLNEETLSSMLEETPEEVRSYVSKLEDTVTALEATAEEQDSKISELEKAVSEISVEEVEEEDAILKSADPVIQELVAKAQADADSARAMAEAEKEARLSKEFSDKAGKFSNLPIEKDALASLLKKVAGTLEDEEFSMLEEMLNGVDATIGKSSLFAEVGSSKESDSNGEIEAIAKGLMTEGVTYEQAYEKALLDNPELYQRYLEGKVS
jgi:predicted phage tail protein